MLRLGPVRIGEEELRWMRWSKQEVVLGLCWTWEEIPVLLDLKGPVLLRWDHVRDERAGVRLYAAGGTARVRSEQSGSANCMVKLELTARPAARSPQ